MQVTVTSNLREKLAGCEEPALRKALKAAIYLEMERRLEKEFGKGFLNMPSTTVWSGKGIHRVAGSYGYRRDARKTRKNHARW